MEINLRQMNEIGRNQSFFQTIYPIFFVTVSV
jgi:hypothetical protein